MAFEFWVSTLLSWHVDVEKLEEVDGVYCFASKGIDDSKLHLVEASVSVKVSQKIVL